MTKTITLDCSNETEFDVCFLIDRSGSICDTDPLFNFSNPEDKTCDNWRLAVNFVYSFVSNIYVGPNNVRVAVIIFDDKAMLMWNLSRSAFPFPFPFLVFLYLRYIEKRRRRTTAISFLHCRYLENQDLF